ncbi:hypothetical protein BC833DRAFT_601309 [Globomyces pollinis-pini]|nr:hypothetical protein BC833DRAFT_601309 [Globomyces pollinis-pini]
MNYIIQKLPNNHPHTIYLATCIALDALSATVLYISYIIIHPDYWLLFPHWNQLVPLDLYLLALTRVSLLSIFLFKYHWAVQSRIPIFTTFVFHF